MAPIDGAVTGRPETPRLAGTQDVRPSRLLEPTSRIAVASSPRRRPTSQDVPRSSRRWSEGRAPTRRGRRSAHRGTGSAASTCRSRVDLRRRPDRTHCRFPARETRRSQVPGRLRRAADRPPPDGDPGADDQGRRLGAGALRRRLLQAAELDVAAVHAARGHHRGRPGRVDRDQSQDRRHAADPARPRSSATPPTTSASTRACRRTASRSTSRSCSPTTPRPSPPGSRWCAASSPPRSGRST